MINVNKLYTKKACDDISEKKEIDDILNILIDVLQPMFFDNNIRYIFSNVVAGKVSERIMADPELSSTVFSLRTYKQFCQNNCEYGTPTWEDKKRFCNALIGYILYANHKEFGLEVKSKELTDTSGYIIYEKKGTWRQLSS